jgi:hypothetical protein
MTVNEAIDHVASLDPKDNACLDAAKIYANAAMTAAIEYGSDGLKYQCLYIVSNLQHWRDPKAKEVRRVLKNFANS